MKKHIKQKNGLKKRQTEAEKLANLSGPADELDAICRRELPDGLIRGGLLQGHEPELRQEALIMCLSGFLEGSSGYADAIASNDPFAIQMEMKKCVAIALKHCKAELSRQLGVRGARNVPINEMNGGHCPHPSDWKTAEWPSDVRVEVVLRAMDAAVLSNELSAGNAGILGMILKEGKDVKAVSETIKVSPNAFYQQMRRFRRVLPQLVEKIDPQ